MNSQAWIFLLANVVLMVAGQSLWKVGLTKIGEVSVGNWTAIALSPYIWIGLVFYGVATLLWLKVLSQVPLSIAYPLVSLAYVLTILVSWLILGESVTWNRWAGSAVILCGVYLVAMK